MPGAGDIKMTTMSGIETFVRRLLPALMMTSSGLAQEYAIESIGFLPIHEPSASGEFTVQGNLVPVSGGVLRGEAFALEGTFQTLVVAGPVVPTELVAHGGFEDPSGMFAPDADGTQLLAISSTGINLLPYGDAEGLPGGDGTVAVEIPGWTLSGPLTVTRWNLPDGWPLNTDPGPPDRGVNFFAGGPDGDLNTATTRVVLPEPAAAIDAGLVPIELSGWFGGFQGQADTASLLAKFLDAAGAEIESFTIGAPTPLQRGNRTGMVFDSVTRLVPPGTREVEVVLEMRRQARLGWNDGYADNLRLVLRDSPTVILPGWSLLGDDVLWCSNTNALGLRSPYGEWFLDLTGTRDIPPYGGVTQTIATTPQTSYELRFALGTHQDLAAFRGPVTVAVSVGTVTNTFTLAPDTRSVGNIWQTFSMPFTAFAASTVISIRGIDSAGGAYIGLDQVTVVPAIDIQPPPLSITLPAGPFNVVEVQLHYPSVSGRKYRLQRVDALTQAAWEDLKGTERVGDGGQVSVRVPIPPGAGAQFYRLKVDR